MLLPISLFPRSSFLSHSTSPPSHDWTRNVANYFPHSLASTLVLSYQSSLPGEIAYKWKSHRQSFATQLFHSFFSSPQSPNRHIRRFTLSSLVLTLFQQLGSLSPTLQRLILHIIQPMICGGLFLLGYLMNRYPLSFIALGVLLIGFFSLLFRALWNDHLEKKENEFVLETLQEEARKKEKSGGVGRDRNSGQDIPSLPSPSPSPLVRESSHGSGRSGSNSVDGSDRDSFSSRERRYSSSAEDFRASYLGKPSSLTSGGRDRVNSAESSGSLPYRMRGSSVDSVGSGSEAIWRSPSNQAEYFNELVIDEIEEKSSEEHNDPFSSNDVSSSSSDDDGDEIEVIIRVNEHHLEMPSQ